ncbi:hypothetical protein PR048_017691 [Dryococelus australis]|uniref:Reverse transcriptase zinc-binding domain-containing protein n=1 Tax=Dryococelus australis TaxID=614101 RepID=A0ABQ9HA75_9NEOP|nr:hypothetical protein PR048_017691 [Dryococelus australis]
MLAVIPSVVNRTPTIRWRRPWKILTYPNLSSNLRAAAFGFYINIVATQQRKYSIHLTADPTCPLCGSIDTALHRAISCVYAAPIWQWCRVRVQKIIRDERGDVSNTHMFHWGFLHLPLSSTKSCGLVYTSCDRFFGGPFDTEPCVAQATPAVLAWCAQSDERSVGFSVVVGERKQQKGDSQRKRKLLAKPHGRGIQAIPEKTRRPTASSGTIPTC